MNKVFLFGYSLGAMQGLTFASENSSLVEALFLVALRKKYMPAEIDYVKQNLMKNKQGYLKSFYKSCFANRRKAQWFKKELLEDYCQSFSLDYLLDTLDCLAKCEVTAQQLNDVGYCKIFHGKNDIIAPVREVSRLCTKTNHELILFDNTGHAVFLEQEIIV